MWDLTAGTFGKGCGGILYGNIGTMHWVVKFTFVGAGLRMALMLDDSGGGAMEMVGMDFRKVGLAMPRSWKAVVVSDMELYCTYAYYWEDPIAWGVSVMLVVGMWGVVLLCLSTWEIYYVERGHYYIGTRS